MEEQQAVDPNARQVGGSHYKAPLQHWDLSVLYRWDPFQYQITKYVMRWRDKNKIQDLEKAQHFLEKYIEQVRAGRIDVTTQKPLPIEVWLAMLGVAMNVPPERVSTWKGFTFEGAKGDVIMYQCDACGAHVELNDGIDPFNEHGHCPGRNYVAQ